MLGNLQQGEGGCIVRPTRDGGYLLVGSRWAGRVGFTPNSYKQPIIHKLDSAGRTVWSRDIGRPYSTTFFTRLLEQPDGSFVCAGYQSFIDSTVVGSLPYGYPRAFAFKVCADGDSLWWQWYRQLPGGRSHNYLTDFQPAPDGGFVGTGFLFPAAPDTGSADAWVFKTDSAGNLVPNAPPVARTCRVVPTGTAPDAGGAAEPVSLYPNPSPSGRFSLSGAGGAEAVITDALGRVVRRQTVAAGSGPAPLDLSGAPPGVYLLRLRWADGRTLTRKLLK